MMEGKNVVLGITACGNAWQTPALVQELMKRGAQVEVILTAQAEHFVTELSLRNISRTPVLTDSFAPPKAWDKLHKPLAMRADLLLVAPASANIIAKAAHGIADDLLTTTILSVVCPILVVPQMSPDMTAKAATQRNLATLQEDGLALMGMDTSLSKGFFPFPDIGQICDRAEALLNG